MEEHEGYRRYSPLHNKYLLLREQKRIYVPTIQGTTCEVLYRCNIKNGRILREFLFNSVTVINAVLILAKASDLGIICELFLHLPSN